MARPSESRTTTRTSTRFTLTLNVATSSCELSSPDAAESLREGETCAKTGKNNDHTSRTHFRLADRKLATLPVQHNRLMTSAAPLQIGNRPGIDLRRRPSYPVPFYVNI